MFKTLGLDERLIKALDAQTITEPTDVQKAVYDTALSGKDLLVMSETGSGKTLAFLLPLVQRILTEPTSNAGTLALILAPTRELAKQLLAETKLILKFTKLRVGIISGGDDYKFQAAQLRKDPEIIIATPGRLLEHFNRNLPAMDKLRVLILDEADRMLDMGFHDDMVAITNKLTKARNTWLFSATLSHAGVGTLAGELTHKPEKISLSTGRQTQANIHQQVVLSDGQNHKQKTITQLLRTVPYEQALVFTNTRVQVDHLCQFLRAQDIKTGAIHGDMAQEDRNKVMELMRKGHVKVLVATDVAARGLDIGGIELVINFDMARNGDDYTHRIGRTGRAGAEGHAISFITPQEWNLKAGVERYLGTSFEIITIPGFESRYKGPEKVKSSGKAAGPKKADRKASQERAAKKKDKDNKVKVRDRDQKNVGKRRTPAKGPDLGDGFAPPTLAKKRPPLKDAEDA
ncbi:DEAD/DEAH box helicase [Simiduia litorea]|uniref:DEAD/DEAH box helicase n=1 Tax=Simiduia litorea TaxID=1435348 RepID=UPI0036F4291D